MPSVSHLLFFLKLIKVVHPNVGPPSRPSFCSNTSCLLREKGGGAACGSPCSGFYFVSFPLQLMKTSLATPMAIREILDAKSGSSEYEKQSSLWEEQPTTSSVPSPPLHYALHWQHTWSKTWHPLWHLYLLQSSSTWRGPAAVPTCRAEVIHKLGSVSAAIRLCREKQCVTFVDCSSKC